MDVRPGYLHAMEGVIAALVVVFYLVSIVSVPETTDWEEAHISKESEDVLRAMDQAGVLDRMVARGDRDSFNALLNQLDSSLSYYISLHGIPQTHIDVGVLVNDSDTSTHTTTAGRWPESTDDTGGSEYGYRKGNLSGPDFGDVPFVLSDLVNNSLLRFSSAYFDFDDNGDYVGPFSFGDRFCTTTPEIDGCYELAPIINDSTGADLVLYDAAETDRFATALENTSLGRRPIMFDVGSINLDREDHEKFDALIAAGWNVSMVAAHQSMIEDFLADDHFLVVVADVAPTTFGPGNYFSDTFDLSFVTAFSLLQDGSSMNVLYSPHNAGNTSYVPNTYYLTTDIIVPVTDVGSRYEGTLTLQQTDIDVRVSDPPVNVSFETESFNRQYQVGDQVTVSGNTYHVQSVNPVKLRPTDQQRFAGFGTARLTADYHTTRRVDPRYNTTKYDAAANYSRAYPNSSRLPPNYGDGIVGTDCSQAENPYKLGYVNVTNTNYTFILVNKEFTSDCNDYYEFLYLDLREDNDVDDDAEQTPLGYSREGPYQYGDRITIKNDTYRAAQSLDGNTTHLKREGPRFVGEIPVSRNVIGGQGSVALFGRESLGDDDMHLLQSLLLAETQTETPFTRFRDFGATSVGYRYTATVGEENKLPYTLRTIWWRQ